MKSNVRKFSQMKIFFIALSLHKLHNSSKKMNKKVTGKETRKNTDFKSTVDSRYLEHRAISRTKLSVPLAPIQAE